VPHWADWLDTHWARGHRRHGIGIHTTARRAIMRQTTTLHHSTSPTTTLCIVVHTDGILGTATGKNSINLSLMLGQQNSQVVASENICVSVEIVQSGVTPRLN
jgi:hypothetical protein